MSSDLPSIGVVIPTRDRPELLRETLQAVAAQSYAGSVEIVVVFDRSTPDRTLEVQAPRRTRVLSNTRTPGLAGTRNTGILSLTTDLVAFCDDDDVWVPEKLARQVAALERHRGVPFATTAIEVAYDDRRIVRQAGLATVHHEDLLRSRMAMLHSSTFLADRAWLVDEVGLLAEEAPGSQNEDWDLLLRVTASGPVIHVDDALVRIRWGRTSFYARDWRARADSLIWMMERHPDILGSRIGAARVFGQMAFACAAMGRRRESVSWAFRALRTHIREWRAVAALAVASGAVTSGRVLDLLHRFGHGV